MNPKISVLLPAYNVEEYITEAIESVLAQSFSDFELIVVDDCSTDQTVEKIKEIGDSRIRLFINEENRGISYSLNRAISEAKGEYFARMDGDDICMPERFQVQYEYIKNREKQLIVGSFYQSFGYINTINLRLLSAEENAVRMLFQSCAGHPTLFFHHSVSKQFKPYYSEESVPAEDYDLLTRLVCSGFKIENIPQVLLRYRILPPKQFRSKYQDKRLTVTRPSRKRMFDYFEISITEAELDAHQKLNSGFVQIEKNEFSTLLDLYQRMLIQFEQKRSPLELKTLQDTMEYEVFDYILRTRDINNYFRNNAHPVLRNKRKQFSHLVSAIKSKFGL